MARSRVIWRPVLVLAFVCLAHETAAAQTDARMVAAVRLAQDGLPDSARAVVRRLLAAASPADSSYAEMLYTSGLIAATEFDRRIALRRVVVEYASSPWADDALLLLAQVEYANGNPGAAVAQVSRLLADYPSSPLIATAAFWGARAASDLHNGAEACRLADAGLATTTDDVELRNQLEYQKQRCAAIVAQASDTATKPVVHDSTVASSTKPAAPTEPVPVPSTKGFRVQVIAAPTQKKADQTVAALKRLGFDAAIVKESGYFKVRAGPFATKAEAQKAMTTIRTRIRMTPFLVPDK